MVVVVVVVIVVVVIVAVVVWWALRSICQDLIYSVSQQERKI
jgi:uncharacterized membrane protein YwzB